ncbi:hypothetical protein [Actinoplanes sp. NPDC051411]|uniref:hypothetical protein n=1 Tax=Actinoplanes sp. NPDC051411 TaxID=3155522 RepID=UPI0034445298
MARPSDWSALKLDGDPTPGDPDILLSVADYMDNMATNAQTADSGLSQVVAKSGDGAFVGKTADWLRKQVTTEMQGFVAGVKQAFTAAGPAIRTYVTALREAQSKADTALNQAGGADEQRVTTLQGDAKSAGEDLKGAASTLQTAIHDAASYIKSPKTPKSACDIFWEIFGWIVLVISVIAIFVGGPLGLIAFGLGAVMAIKTIVDFAEGKTNLLGLVLGLLSVLGPSTRPLISLSSLTKLAGAAWKNIVKFAKSGATTITRGLADFWTIAHNFSFGQVFANIGDISVVVANSVKIGLLSIPKFVTSLDNLAVHGFVTLKNFVVQDVPRALAVTFPGALNRAFTTIKGTDFSGLAHVAVTQIKTLAANEFGGWKALRLFTPLAADEIGKFGVLGAFKVGVLGRGLNISEFSKLGALGTGARLVEGLTHVNVIHPGGTPHVGGGNALNFSPSGLHLPDLTEHAMTNVHTPNMSLSATGVDFSGISTVGAHDLAGLNHLNTANALHLGGFDLSAPGRTDVGNLGAVDHLNLPAMGGLGAVPMPNMHMGNLGAGLNKFTNGIDGLPGFGGAEMRALNTGDVSAMRISDTGVSFNLGLPETAFHAHGADLGSPVHLNAGHVDTKALGALHTGNLGSVHGGDLGKLDLTGPPARQLSVDRAMNLLAHPKAALDHDVVNLSHQSPRPDEAGFVSPAQANHLHALDQLRRAHDSLGNASGDALAVARAQKDIRVAESLVKRTAEGLKIEHLDPAHLDDAHLQQRLDDLRGPGHPSDPDLAGAELQLKTLAANTHTDPAHLELNLPSVPAHHPGTSVDELGARLDALRGADHRPHLSALDHGPGGSTHTTHLTAADFPTPPSLSPADAIARSTAHERLTHLEGRLSDARAEEPPHTPEPAADHLTDAQLRTRLDALRGDHAMPHAPTGDPVRAPGAHELSVRLDQLTHDARQAHLPGDEVERLTTDARTALTDGRLGDAAEHLNALHSRIDAHNLDIRLESFRSHVDGGHGRAAQLGMGKVEWLEHAAGIERAASLGHADDLQHLLNAYENALAGYIVTQRLHDLPHPPEHLPEASEAGEFDDLEARLSALRDGHDGPPVEDHGPHFDGGDDAPPPELPTVPAHDPGEALLGERFTALRDGHNELLGMSEGERARWQQEFALAADLNADADVLGRYTERIRSLERDGKLGELRDGTGDLPAGEHETWQDAFGAAGGDQATIDRILDNYMARLDQYREHRGAQISQAMSSADHITPLDTRLDRSLSSLSEDLRDANAAEFTSLSDKLAALRGADDRPPLDHAPGFTHTDTPPSFPATPHDLPTTPKDPGADLPSFPEPPRDLPAGPKAEPKVDAPKAGQPKIVGDQSAEMVRPPAEHVGDDLVPPRELLGGATRTPDPGRTVDVDTDRWTALREPFRFEKAAGDHPFTVSRPVGGGERIAVRYQLTATDQELTFTLKVHLDADATVAPHELADLKAATHDGVRRFVNDPAPRLPGHDQPIRVAVEFVDDPALAHTSVHVGHGVDGMNQGAWKVGATPGAYAHEVVHYLGAQDGLLRDDALLRPVEPTGTTAHDLMGPQAHDEAYEISPAALGQIAEVLAPHFSGSLGSRASEALVTHPPENLWESLLDVAPNVRFETTLDAIAEEAEEIPLVPLGNKAVPAEPKIEPPKGGLPGFYAKRPELLYEVDSIGDLDRLVTDIDAGVNAAVHARLDESWRGKVPLFAGKAVDTSHIAEALRTDKQSFFASGGRSFDVEDGTGAWHRVTIRPDWKPEDTKFLSQADDKAKFDTRADFSQGTRESVTTGGTGALGANVTIPQRIGPGGGFGGEMALSRPIESAEETVRLTDSHNVRSGGPSHLVDTPVKFHITAEDARAGIGQGISKTATPVDTDVAFRSVDDIAKATGAGNVTPVHLDEQAMAEIVEHFTPVRILRAGLDLDDGTVPAHTWQQVSEQILVKLNPSKTVDPGSLGAGNARDLFSESSVISHLIPALDGPVHPPVISSAHNAHALSLQLEATMPEFSVLAKIDKTSFRWQPGIGSATKVQQTSRTGGALSVIPIRWAFGPGYAQLRLSGGFFRSLTASHSSASASRIGTEFKDIKNVGVEAHIRLKVTPAVREVPGSRLWSDGRVPVMDVDLVVFGRLPLTKAIELAGGVRTLTPSPKTWFVPPYAKTGGRSVTYGLTDFGQLQSEVIELIRRFEGGFLPKFADQTRVTRMGSSRTAIERARNQSALDRVITPAGLRQGQPALLKWGLIAELTRTKKIGTRHVVVHVTGRYVNDFDHLGQEKGQAVRNVRSDGTQTKIVAAGQWRGNVTLEGGGVFRFSDDHVSAALSPYGAVEYRGRFGKQGGSQLTGNEVRLNGGTPDSQVFGNQLEITVHVYSYTKRPGLQPKSRVGMGQIVSPRPARPSATHAPAPATEVVGELTRYRLTESKPVRVLYDNSTVLPHQLTQEPVFTPRPDALGVSRRTQLDVNALRDWVDAGDKLPVHDWLSIEAMPGNRFILDLARDALTAAQKYADDVFSHTRIGGQYGIDGLEEGKSLWIGLIGRLNDIDEVGQLRAMLNDQWTVDKLMSNEDGAQVDLAVSVSLSKPELLPAHGHITVENASIGGVEVDGAKSTEHQIVGRVNGSANIRKPGTTGSTHGGGGVLQGGVEKIAYARTERKSESLSGAIERNANNRKGKTRAYVVKFDMRVTVAAEITTDPDRFAIIPQALRSGDWLHHFKSIQRDGTITNAVYLRLEADVVEKLGLLPKLDADPGTIAKPWFPSVSTSLRLAPGHGPGLGLYAFRETPDLIAPARKALASTRIADSINGRGLADPMLNRRRLLYLFTPLGVKQHWPSMVDGGVSVLHLKPGRMTQHARDVRLIAEPAGEPVFKGFVASHDDLDIKTTLVQDTGTTVQRTHGSSVFGTASGTGVSNHHGENLAMGVGDSVGASSHTANSQASGLTTVHTNMSSGRGVKARMTFPAKFSLMVFDRGKPVGEPLLVVHDVVEQDRWADDLRLPRDPAEEVKAPAPYEIAQPGELGPGWTTSNGLPIPPRFSAEDMTQIAHLQKTVEKLLTGAAKRLAKPGYAGAHTIHQGLTPAILLPGVGQMITKDGLDLPKAVSAQIFGQSAKVNIKLVPEAASLGGVSSGVFREHAPLTTSGYSAGTNQIVQSLRTPRIPLVGRGYADDAYQALEQGGPGISAGDSQVATESGSGSTGVLGNTKPESRSAAIDYLSRVEITIQLDKTFGKTKFVSSASPDDISVVTLRMGLHDSRTALGLSSDASKGAFETLVAHEKNLATAADEFVAAAEKLDATRFDAYRDPGGAKEQEIPGLVAAWETAGEKWWALEQQQYKLLDQFRHDYLGVASASATDVRMTELAQHIQGPADKATPMLPVAVPRDGNCQLYSMVASNPSLIGDRLATAGLGSPELHAWLKNSGQVRSQIGEMVRRPGPVPAGSELAQAAGHLRTLVHRNLHDGGAASVPLAAINAFRHNNLGLMRTEVEGLSREQLIERVTGEVHPDASLGELYDRAMDHYVDPARPLDDMEYAQIMDAVENWPTAWAGNAGETFLPLLAHGLDARIDVHQPRFDPLTLGRDDAPLIQVHRDGDHYDGATAKSRAAVPVSAARPVNKLKKKVSVPVPATPGAVPGGLIHNVPGEGRCQLYSVLGSAPDRVRARLDASTGLHDWLGNPRRIQSDLETWRGNGIRNDDGLVPTQTDLGHAAEQLRNLAENHLQTLGREHVPTQVVRQYRNHAIMAGVRDEIDGMSRAALLARLDAYGVTRAETGQLLPLSQLREAYQTTRTAELVASGRSANSASIRATREIKLNAHGGLHDDALSMRQMFDYLAKRGVHFELAKLDDATLRDVTAHHYLDANRALDRNEFDGLVRAVADWENAYGTPLGEAFLPLLADTLDVQFRVHQTGIAPALAGREGADVVDIFRSGDHYMAVSPAVRPAGPAPFATLKNLSRSVLHKLSKPFTPRPDGSLAFAKRLRRWNQLKNLGSSHAPRVDRFQTFADRHGLAIYVRPADPAGIRWRDGLAVPRPQSIRAETINKLDVQLGASEHTIGLAGLMRPAGAPDHGLLGATALTLPKDASPALRARYDQRVAEFNRLAPEIAEQVRTGQIGLHNGILGLRDADDVFAPVTGDHAVFDVRKAPASSERGAAATQDLDHDYGPAVYPKKVKPFELSPPQPHDAKGVKGDALQTQAVRVNPALMKLADFDELLWAGRPEAHWHYVVAPDGQIWIGSEELLTAVSERQIADLFTAMSAKDPTLTIEQLRAAINEQGHPTIGARFTDDGTAWAGPARISGELSRDDKGVWTVNDKSGRYMSDKVRPGIQPPDVKRWLTNVAARMSDHFGTEVRPQPYKHSDPPPPQDPPPPPPAPKDDSQLPPPPPPGRPPAPPALPESVLNLLADTTEGAPPEPFSHLREPAEFDRGMTNLLSHSREPAEADRGPADLDVEYGPAVYPKKVKPFELSPPQPHDAKGVKGDALPTQEVRINPALMPLSGFHDFVWAGRPDAHWHYVVDPGGQIWIGSEELLTAVSDRQIGELFTAMYAKDPTLTVEQLKASINEQGHPTIGARFTDDGTAWAGPARISGELSRDPGTGVWTVNDKSGRYMSDKVRPGVQPADVKRWLTNVAEKMSEQLGEEVRPLPYKHGAQPPPVPEEPQAALPPDVLALLKF